MSSATDYLYFLHLEYQCGDSFNERKGNFSSPGYPLADYPNNLECVWKINTTEGSRIIIDIKIRYLRYHWNCYYDYIKVSLLVKINIQTSIFFLLIASNQTARPAMNLFGSCFYIED